MTVCGTQQTNARRSMWSVVHPITDIRISVAGFARFSSAYEGGADAIVSAPDGLKLTLNRRLLLSCNFTLTENEAQTIRAALPDAGPVGNIRAPWDL